MKLPKIALQMSFSYQGCLRCYFPRCRILSSLEKWTNQNTICKHSIYGTYFVFQAYYAYPEVMPQIWGFSSSETSCHESI